MTKDDCLNVFNAIVKGESVSFQDKLLPMVSEYLTENNIENSEKMINSIIRNPQLIELTIPDAIDYYCRKYEILSLIQMSDKNNKNINKTIMYYE